MQSRSFVLRKERNFGQKIEATFEFIRVCAKPLFKSLLFFAGPFALVGSFLVTGLFQRVLFLGSQAGTGVDQSTAEMFSLGLSIMGLSVIMIFAMAMVFTVINGTMHAYDHFGDAKFTHNDVWKVVKKRYWQLFATLFLFGIIFFVLYMIFALFTVMISAILPLLMIPIIYLFMGFFFIVVSMTMGGQVFEKKSLGKALSRTFILLKNNWWRSLGLLIILLLIYNVVVVVFALPFYINTFMFVFNSAEAGVLEEPSLLYKALNYIFGIILMLGSSMTYSLPIIGMNLQFYHLVEIRDAKSLMDRLEDFGNVEEESSDEDF